MMPERKTDATSQLSMFSRAAAAAAQPCKVCGSSPALAGTLSAAVGKDLSDLTQGQVDALKGQMLESEYVAMVVRVLDATGVLNDLPAAMRLLAHVAEHAGYLRAQQEDSSNVTELMLIAARASALAEQFRGDA